MPIGPAIRAMFGKHERRIADAYRGLFMNLDDFAAKIGEWGGQPRRILEVGCGEGAVTEKLAKQFPEAAILAIDITSRAGRLYEGRPEGVEFRVATIQEIARDEPGAFDLIVMSDVVHHIPPALRGEIVDSIGLAMAPGGRFILKDWSPSVTPIHWLCHAGDRWLTGDHVIHLKPVEAQKLVLERLPAFGAVAEGRVRPWANNYVMVFG